jgi:hypothetical protein
MSKLSVTMAVAMLCVGSLLSVRAEAMTSAAAGLRAAMAATNPVENAACGWYPSSYPESWAVYTPGWGCTYSYPAYYYDPYVYGLYDRAYYPRLWYRGRPYWRQRARW